MSSFSGKFQYLAPDGSPVDQGSCRVTFEAETLTLTPGSGAPLAFDLGDIDVFAPADYELALTLYTGNRILLNCFGKSFPNLRHDLLEACRNRWVECLLLADLEEIARFDGFARLDSPQSPSHSFSSPAEFRLLKSNLAVLPEAATGFQWRLADIYTINFDESDYAVVLESAGKRLTVTKLAKRTREFVERLRDGMTQLAEISAGVARSLFPFLTPDQVRQAAHLMKEGRAVPVAKLKAIHPRTGDALIQNAVDAELKPYFEVLLNHVPPGWLYAGFKVLREDEGETGRVEAEAQASGAEEVPAQTSGAAQEEFAEDNSQSEAAEARDEASPILYWFFFPLAVRPGDTLPGNLVAWEATSRSGRATYFFRLVPPEQAGQLHNPETAPAIVDAAIRQLNRAIVTLNFRREPIYLPDEALEIQPRFRRYAIARRKIPELGRLRASFLGRATHTSPLGWQKQFESFLAHA